MLLFTTACLETVMSRSNSTKKEKCIYSLFENKLIRCKWHKLRADQCLLRIRRWNKKKEVPTAVADRGQMFVVCLFVVCLLLVCCLFVARMFVEDQEVEPKRGTNCCSREGPSGLEALKKSPACLP